MSDLQTSAATTSPTSSPLTAACGNLHTQSPHTSTTCVLRILCRSAHVGPVDDPCKPSVSLCNTRQREGGACVPMATSSVTMRITPAPSDALCAAHTTRPQTVSDCSDRLLLTSLPPAGCNKTRKKAAGGRGGWKRRKGRARKGLQSSGQPSPSLLCPPSADRVLTFHLNHL